jgi:hypothetical protein
LSELWLLGNLIFYLLATPPQSAQDPLQSDE